MRIPLTRPAIGDSELARVRQVLESGHLVSGPQVRALEDALSQRFGFGHAVAVGSGTDAIRIALVALDIGPGSQVIVPDFCFPSVAAAVLHAGAECVLCDIDPLSFNLTPETVARVVTDKTAAIIAVHQFGVPCGTQALAEVFSGPIIEDAACALGATENGEFCGTRTTVGCFSFHPRKIMTTAEGGLITTRREDVADRCKWLRSHGFHRTETGAVFEEVGFAARMSDVHAAIGLGQLERLDLLISGRQRSAQVYREGLDELSGVETCDATWQPGRVYQSLVVSVGAGVDRNHVVALLRQRGIESTVGTYAIHCQPVFLACKVPTGGLPGSTGAAANSLTLPLWPDMPADTVGRVLDSLREVLS